MLRYLVLCLATALAAGFDENNPPHPVYSRRFTMTFDLTDYVNLLYYHNRVWFDAHVKNSRIDIEDMKYVIIGHSKEFKYGKADIVYPITTESNEVKPECLYIVGHESIPLLPEDHLPSFGKLHYDFIGKERINDQDAYVWSISFSLFGLTTHSEIVVAYTGETNDYNQTLAIPIREKTRRTIDESGIIVMDEVKDFYDYQPVDKIDPDIWNIHKGITCKKFGHRKNIYQFLNLRGNHEDYNRKQMSQDFEEYIKPRVGHKFEWTDSCQSSTAMFGSTAEPNNALPFPYSESEIEEMSRDLPEEFDWRDYGAVTPVKDGLLSLCYSSWAFSATGAIEGYYYLKTGRYHVLWMNEQVLLDCSWGFGNEGCFSGRPEHAFEWVKKYGIMSGIHYREFNALHNVCNLTGVEISTNITGYTRVPQSENALKVALYKYGPLSVEVRVGDDFKTYEGGIYKQECDNFTIFMLLVGYGVRDAEKYWILKSFFKTDWGANGYMYLAAEDNLCGVQNSVYYVQ